ncbi:MAG: hypothetical protein WB626_10160 [Bacteroidota bacterium]
MGPGPNADLIAGRGERPVAAAWCAAAVCGCLLWLTGAWIHPGGLPHPAGTAGEPVFMEGEDLLYEVRWSFVRLGTIRIVSRTPYEARAHIDSYPDLPLADLHSVYFTSMDSLFCSHRAWAADRSGKRWRGMWYTTDAAGGRVLVESGMTGTPGEIPEGGLHRDTLRIAAGRFVDGLAIGFFPRRLLFAVGTVRVPTVLNGRLGTTEFRFGGIRTTEEIEAWGEPIRVVEVAGHTDAEGIFGMTGEFAGLFSDDDACVPIRGRLKVLIGDVVVELIGWRRSDWNPPS